MAGTCCTLDFILIESGELNKLRGDLDRFKHLAEQRQKAIGDLNSCYDARNLELSKARKQIGDLQSEIRYLRDASHVASEMKQLREQRNKALDGQAIANARSAEAERKLAGQGIDWPYPGAILVEWECHALPNWPRSPFQQLLPEYEIRAKFRWNGRKD
jgi:chromosome segregation ATPase